MNENVTMLTVLQELREFRKETNERFDLMDKRITKLEEKVDKLDERVCRLEEKVDKLDKRVCILEEKVDKLDERVCRLELKVDKLDERVIRLEHQVNEINDKATKLEERVSNLEEGRKTDRREILDVLDTMQKSISKQFIDLKHYMDIEIEKFSVAGAANDVEHAQFRQLLKAYGIKIDIQDCKVKYLEKWKKDFGEGDFVAAF